MSVRNNITAESKALKRTYYTECDATICMNDHFKVYHTRIVVISCGNLHLQNGAMILSIYVIHALHN